MSESITSKRDIFSADLNLKINIKSLLGWVSCPVDDILGLWVVIQKMQSLFQSLGSSLYSPIQGELRATVACLAT